jgi:hypothetical protein
VYICACGLISSHTSACTQMIQHFILRWRSTRREALLVAMLLAKRADIPGGRWSAICLHSIKPRSQIATIYTIQSLSTPPRSSATSLARAVSRRLPHRHRPCVVRSPALFSARSATAHAKPGLCVVFLSAIGAFQRHSTQHLSPPLLVPFRSRHCFRRCPIRLLLCSNVLGVALAA